MNEIMKTVNSLQESGLLIKSVSKTIKNEEKEQCYKIHYEIYKQVKSQLKQVNTRLEQARIFMPSYPLINFEMQRYYQNEPKFNGIYSRNNLLKIKERAYVINLDEFT